jgi:oxygen-independent coproporphyrinogen-3 oxidase
MEKKIPAYVDALCREVEIVSGAAGQRLPVYTIFFGGGTPSLLPGPAIQRILDTVRVSFELATDAEITLEANPGTVSQDYLRFLRDQGVNRLSFGMQSADQQELAWLTRQHSFQDVVLAVEWARAAGFDNLSLDLIFGLPTQTQETWMNSLEQALKLGPEHLSLYSLIVEPETPLFRWVERGLVESPDDDNAAEMYEYAMERLERAGFQQYEISNWAKLNAAGDLLASKHNSQYWLNLPYLGFGAGAHGYAAGSRTANVKPIDGYVRKINNADQLAFPFSPANASAVAVDLDDEIAETMMVGLRLTETGVDEQIFQARFGKRLDELFAEPIKRLQAQGLLEWAGNENRRLRLTKPGRLLGNRVFREFI